MSHHEFVTPTNDEVLDAIGVVPEVSPNDEFVRVVSFDVGNGHDRVRLMNHVVVASVEFQWLRDSEVIVHITREGAASLAITSGQGRATIHASFESGSDHSELDIQIHPAVRIKDTTLTS